jgi:hypothetical protein
MLEKKLFSPDEDVKVAAEVEVIRRNRVATPAQTTYLCDQVMSRIQERHEFRRVIAALTEENNVLRKSANTGDFVSPISNGTATVVIKEVRVPMATKNIISPRRADYKRNYEKRKKERADLIARLAQLEAMAKKEGGV